MGLLAVEYHKAVPPSSFDDSSSISSGDISDTIAEISTDENLTGSSLSTGSDVLNPYGSLKRAPNDLTGKTINLLNAKRSNAILDRNLNLHGHDSVDNWRKYQIRRDPNDISDTRSDGSLERGHWSKERNDLKAFNPYRTIDIQSSGKVSQGTVTDIRRGRQVGVGPSGIALEDPHLKTLSDGGQSPAEIPQKVKKDSETNTDQSMLMMRKQQQMVGRPGAGFGLRRPLSGASTASTGSNKSSGSAGERLANYKGSGMIIRPTKTSSGSQTTISTSGNTDMGPEAYSATTLERKKKAMMAAKQSPTSPGDYASSTLGRKKPEANLKERLFGSRGSLNKMSVSSETPLVGTTIISNPHATFSKHDGSSQTTRSYVVRSTGQSITTPSISQANYVNLTYLSQNYLSGGLHSPTSPSSGSPWLKSAPSSLNGHNRSGLSETESMESISSAASSSIHAQIQQARAHSLVSRNILQHEHENQAGSTGIVRSDSFRSSQSEKLYHGGSEMDDLIRANSITQLSPTGQPSSPTPSQGSAASSRFTYPLSALSPTTAQNLSMGRSGGSSQNGVPYTGFIPLAKITKDDDTHGSSLSLVSSSSSVYSTAEEKTNSEIRKLRRELDQAQDKVHTLTSQLSTNAHVVAAFEQSLSNMTSRLQHLTTSAEAKDSELNELRQTIEALKIQSGIYPAETIYSPGSLRRQSSSSREPSTPGSLNYSPWKYSFDAGEAPRLARHMSSESMSSINSLSSACSATSQQSSATDSESKKNKKKNKNWLRSSFSKAFSRGKKNKHGSVSDVEPDTMSLRSDLSVPNSPLLYSHANGGGILKPSHSSTALCDDPEKDVELLKDQLHEKDMKLTDIQLEALSSAHQLEQLRDTMTRMKTEMLSLKADNDRLHRLVSSKGMSPSSDVPSSHSSTSLDKRLSLGEAASLDLMLSEAATEREGQRITISIPITAGDLTKSGEQKISEILIGAIAVSGKTKWEMLDGIVRRVFKEFVLRCDPVTNLGLNAESVHRYSIGDITRSKEHKTPELLPCGYLVGDNTNITLNLKCTQQNSVDNLAFETLMPKSIVQRYVSLLVEHRRIILCGPSGTGKTYLAQKLAEFLVLRSGKDFNAGSIATFNVDHKSSKELRQYLANIAEQCESSTAGELPAVIILDNLHHIGSLGEVFNGFLSVKYPKCPYIIGTMNQATCSTTNLQLHHNFRWVLCANHMEPVKGFLGRYLRRKLIDEEVSTGVRNNDLNKMIDWIPKVWAHLNKFLETHSSSDVTIGPRLFLSCPMDMSGSQVWFTDLWNYSIVPYLLEAVREGLQLYGRRAPWEDPADWVIESYPWPHPDDADWPSLLRLRPEDVGYDTQTATGGTKTSQGAQQSDAEGDPLLNMLMRLQEAASYSSPQSNDSDSTSLDSHSSAHDMTSTTPATSTTTTVSSSNTHTANTESTL